LEHVLIENVEHLFWDMLSSAKMPIERGTPKASRSSVIRFTYQLRGPLAANVSKNECLRATVAEPNQLENRHFLANAIPAAYA
jgi:hypothetical protein